MGRYLGLKAIEALGAPHDCLELQYDGGKLFLPVENIELLTRYGSDEGARSSIAWAARAGSSAKRDMKERVRAIAAELIRIAAARQLKSLPPVEPPHGLYDEFCARFPYQETEDQEKAIAEAIADLGRGRPMDRLVCGDVGFGKTEVALRAAFVAAMAGEQVAVVVPTTLAGAPALSRLCRTLHGISRSRCASFRASWMPRRRAKPRRRWPKAMSISWWAPMRCWPKASTSSAWAW